MKGKLRFYEQGLRVLYELDQLGLLMDKVAMEEKEDWAASKWQLNASDNLRRMLGLPYGEAGDGVTVERCPRCPAVRVVRRGQEEDPWKNHDDECDKIEPGNVPMDEFEEHMRQAALSVDDPNYRD